MIDFNEKWFNEFLRKDHSQFVGSKHHLVPRFYLENFADGKGKILEIDKETAASRLTTPLNALSVRDFNTIIDKGGKASGTVEALFGEVESNASEIIRPLLVSPYRQFPVVTRERSMLSLFAGMQVVRGRLHRKTLEGLVDLIPRIQYQRLSRSDLENMIASKATRPPDVTLETLENFIGRLDQMEFVPHSNTSVLAMLELIKEATTCFLPRPITIVSFEEDCLATCDEPLIPISRRSPTIGLSGYWEADEIWLTLNQSHLLVFGPLGFPLTETNWIQTFPTAQEINQLIVDNSYQSIITTPGSDHLRQVVWPQSEPIFHVDGAFQASLPREVLSRLNDRRIRSRYRNLSQPTVD